MLNSIRCFNNKNGRRECKLISTHAKHCNTHRTTQAQSWTDRQTFTTQTSTVTVYRLHVTTVIIAHH